MISTFKSLPFFFLVFWEQLRWLMFRLTGFEHHQLKYQMKFLLFNKMVCLVNWSFKQSLWTFMFLRNFFLVLYWSFVYMYIYKILILRLDYIFYWVSVIHSFHTLKINLRYGSKENLGMMKILIRNLFWILCVYGDSEVC